jgi:flagellar assembly protein FliH
MAKVLKSGRVSTRPVRIGEADLEEFPRAEPMRIELPCAAEDSESVVEAIDPEALREAVLEEARAEAAQKVKQAYAEAYERGQENGRAAFDASVGEAAQCLRHAGEAVRRARETFLESLEPQVVELATLIARRVLQREVRTDSELIHTTVRRALAVIADRQRLTVRVNARDLITLRAHKIALLDDFAGIEEFQVEASEEVSPGGCMVESRQMHADVRLETLLDVVLRELAEE